MKKIFLSADIEGTAGIVHWDETETGKPLYDRFARQMTREDYQKYDWLIGMEESNLRNMRRITGGDPEGKIRRLLDFSDRPRDIADPWFTGNFVRTYEDIREGCEALLGSLCPERL